MLPVPLIQPLHLAVGSDLSLAEEQLCHWRVRWGGRQKFRRRESVDLDQVRLTRR